MSLANILLEIYGGGLENKDLAMILRKIYQTLDDSFYEEAPSPDQRKTLNDLLNMADRVEIFFK